MAAKGTTAAQVDERVRACVKLLARGATRDKWLRYAAENYKVSERTAETDLARARDQIRADWDIQRQDLLAAMLAEIQDLYAEARDNQQLSTALAAINSKARMTGIIS